MPSRLSTQRPQTSGGCCTEARRPSQPFTPGVRASWATRLSLGGPSATFPLPGSVSPAERQSITCGAGRLGKRTSRAGVSLKAACDPASATTDCGTPGHKHQLSSWSLRLGGKSMTWSQLGHPSRQQRKMGTWGRGCLLHPAPQDVMGILGLFTNIDSVSGVSPSIRSRSCSGVPFSHALVCFSCS